MNLNDFADIPVATIEAPPENPAEDEDSQPQPARTRSRRYMRRKARGRPLPKSQKSAAPVSPSEPQESAAPFKLTIVTLDKPVVYDGLPVNDLTALLPAPAALTWKDHLRKVFASPSRCLAAVSLAATFAIAGAVAGKVFDRAIGRDPVMDKLTPHMRQWIILTEQQKSDPTRFELPGAQTLDTARGEENFTERAASPAP